MSSKGHRRLPTSLAGLSRWRPSPRVARPSHPPAQQPIPASAPSEPADVIAAGPSLTEQLAAEYERGVSDGRAAAEAVIAAERARVAATLAELAGVRRAVLDAADQDLIRLAIGMARRVLHREVQLDPDILLAMARTAIGRLGDRAVAQVHLNPDDLGAIAAASPRREGLTLVADANVPRGGCRISSDVGDIDLGIDAQMSELSRVLLADAAQPAHARFH